MLSNFRVWSWREQLTDYGVRPTWLSRKSNVSLEAMPFWIRCVSLSQVIYFRDISVWDGQDRV